MKTFINIKTYTSFKISLFILGLVVITNFCSFGQTAVLTEAFTSTTNITTTGTGFFNNTNSGTCGNNDIFNSSAYHATPTNITNCFTGEVGAVFGAIDMDVTGLDGSNSIIVLPYMVPNNNLLTFSGSFVAIGSNNSGNNITVAYSIDNGFTYTTMITFTVNSTTVYDCSLGGQISNSAMSTKTATIGSNLSGQTIKIKVTYTGFTSGDEGFVIDEFKLFETCTSPTSQASSLSISGISCTSMDLAWAGGNGNNVLVVAKASGSTLTDPTSGASYTANNVFAGAGASQIGTGNYVVFNGVSSASSSVTVSGLTSGITYNFAIYEYNSSSTCYNLTELSGTQATQGTPLTVTTYNPADNSSGSLTQNITLTFNENIQAGTSGTITIIKPGPAVFETIAYNSSNLTFSGNQLIINPTNPFVANAVYTVQIASTAVKGMCTNSYAGISNFTDWNFTAVSPKKYYVNDNSTTGDIYTTAVGINSSGKGTASATPALTLSWLLNSSGYTFVFGDTIFIDAGIYAKGGTPSVTTESKFNITVSGLTFIGAGMGVTTFSNNFHGGGTDYFMQITANNTTVKNMTLTKYYGGAPNSGTVYNGINTGGQVLSIYNATGIVIENVSLFDNGTNGNAAIAIGPNSSVLLKGGGSNCNATGSSYSGGIDAIGNAINLNIQNVIIAYNSKTLFDGAGLYVYSIHNTNFVNVKNSTFINNLGGQGGGAGVYCNGGNVAIRESSIQSNTVSTSGGPYYVGAGIGIVSGTMTLTKCKISDNKSSGASTASFGGVGLTPSSGNVILKIDSCSFSGNTGQRTTGNDIGARINGSNTFSITINETTFSTGAIDIGGGSTNSCAGNTFKITNSGNPTITYSGSGPCTLDAGSNTSSPYTFASPTIPSFTGNCSNFVILPIELTRFEGDCNNGKVILNWQTASEKSNQVFNIERSGDGVNFVIIGSLKGAGNSSKTINYTFIDENKLEGLAYYRLSQTDYDGKMSQSKIIYVDNLCNQKLDSEISIYPNPTRDNFTLDLKLFQSAEVSVEIIDGIGRVVNTIGILKYKMGLQSLNIDVNNLCTGVYFLKVIVDTKPTTHKLIKL